MHRIEVDLGTGERLEILQTAYRNAEGDVLVRDATESAPSGYEEFDPAAEVTAE